MNEDLGSESEDDGVLLECICWTVFSTHHSTVMSHHPEIVIVTDVTLLAVTDERGAKQRAVDQDAPPSTYILVGAPRRVHVRVAFSTTLLKFPTVGL